MTARRSTLLVRAMTVLSIAVFASAARAGDPRREVEALRQEVLGPVDGAAGQGAAPGPEQRASWLRRLDGRVLPHDGERAEEPAGMLARDVRSRVQAANLRENRAWEAVKDRDDWERFREPRLRAFGNRSGCPQPTPAPRGCSSRGSSTATATSAALSEAGWMLGQALVGSRLRDVRSVLHYLRTRDDLDAGRVALWGDSFAPANPRDRDLAVPPDAVPFPHQAEPLGGLLALFTALFEDDVRAVSVRGGLTGFESLLHGQFCYVPHDALVPGALTAGDLCDVAASLAPRPLRMAGLVDGLDQAVEPVELARVMEPARSAYRALEAETSLELGAGDPAGPPAAGWLLGALRAGPGG